LRILGIGANPDDLEILCAGTLAKYGSRGHEIIMCHVTKGEKGHFHIPSDELANIRKEEASESAKVIGAEIIPLDFSDGEIFSNNNNVRLKFINMIRQAKPDIIITHSTNDYFVDHTEVSKAVFDCSFLSSVPYIKTDYDYHPKVPAIYYMDTLAGVGFNPTIYIDITQTIKIKLEMLAKHQSQVKWLKEHDKVDILEFVESVARFRGIQCGVEYAEGFTLCQAWLRNIPGELFFNK
jgi:N-acetylglucosamine malate deacetylase 1